VKMGLGSCSMYIYYVNVAGHLKVIGVLSNAKTKPRGIVK
jgi:hypothetical protein